MNGLDWVLVAIGLFGLGHGLLRGAVSQVFGIAGALGGFWVATRYYVPLAAQLSLSFPQLSPSQATVAGFIALLFLTWFCIRVAGYGIARLIRGAGLGFMDRFLGGVLGVGKGLVVAVILISLLTLVLSIETPFLRDSVLAPHVRDMTKLLIDATPVSVQKEFEQKQTELKRYWLEEKGKAPQLAFPEKPEKKEKEAGNGKRYQ